MAALLLVSSKSDISGNGASKLYLSIFEEKAKLVKEISKQVVNHLSL